MPDDFCPSHPLTLEGPTVLYFFECESHCSAAGLQGGASAVAMEPRVRAAPSQDVAPLVDVLTYRNDLVVRRFRKRFAISQEDADAVFVELLRWLWYLASTSPTPNNPEAHAIDQPLLILDEMWHEFIIVTQDYTKFCDDMCRRYIHHDPNSSDDVHTTPGGLREVTASLAALLGRKRAKYTAIYDILGKDVFVLWYLHFPQRFSSEAISRMSRKMGLVDGGLPQVSDKRPQMIAQNKKDLIEEALFMNLFRSMPDEAGPLGTIGDSHCAQGAGISPQTRCKLV